MNAGTKLGSYEITARVGAGGMGEVYEALDTKLNRKVVIKLLPKEASIERRQRFEEEARAASALDHPNIAAVHDILDVVGRLAIVMQLVSRTSTSSK